MTTVRIFNTHLPTRTLLLLVSEIVISYFALMLAAWVQFGSDSASIYGARSIPLAAIASLCVICLYYYDLYDLAHVLETREALGRLIQVVGTTCIILSFFYYIHPSFWGNNPLFTPGVLFMGLCLVAWRELFSLVNRSPRLVQRAILVGQTPLAGRIADEIQKHPELGYQLVGFVGESDNLSDLKGPDLSGPELNGARRIGKLADLTRITQRQSIDRIIVAIGERREQFPIEELLELKTRGVVVEEGTAFYEAAAGKIDLDSLILSQLLFSEGFRTSRAMLAFKRASSLLISLMLLILALPVMAMIAVAIWVESGGPILFLQRRVGKDGRLFTLYKFRSMKIDGNVNARVKGKIQPAVRDDLRFTAVGRTIRRLRVDELPQLYNILRGDMDFIGPRPFMLEEEEELAVQIPHYKWRWSVRPGATGWAQVCRPYCATIEDNRDKLSYDLFYIKKMSPGLDLLILLKTAKILIWGRGSR